jgi:hypothetical protein
MLNSYTELTSTGKFASNKGGENLFVDIIVNGLSKTAEEQAAEVTGDWHGKQYLALRESAWKKLVTYYTGLN